MDAYVNGVDWCVAGRMDEWMAAWVDGWMHGWN